MSRYVVIGYLDHHSSSWKARADSYQTEILNSSMGRSVGVWESDNPEQADRTAWRIADCVGDIKAGELVAKFRSFVQESSTDPGFHPLPTTDVMNGAVVGLVEITYGFRGGLASICPVSKVNVKSFSSVLEIADGNWLRGMKLDRDFPIFACFETMSLG